MSACRNCEAALAEGQRFCGRCGQKADSGRLTLGHIGHDLLHAFLHVDHSILALIKALLLRPGRVAREYVDGRRKKYFGPFAFLVIVVGLASFMIVITGVQWFKPITDSGAAGLLQHHINLVILIQMPLLAASCNLFFWSERLHYAEHLVFAAYTSSFRVLLLALVATPLMYLTQTSSANPIMVIAYYGLSAGYFVFAAAQFYGGNRVLTICKALCAAAVTQAMTLGVIFVFIILFARISGQ